MGTPRPALTEHRNGAPERSTLELLLSIADETKHLLTKEVELARIEIVEALLARVKAVAGLAVAGFFGIFVAIFGALAAASALDNVLRPWASRLVVAVAFALMAGAAALFAKKRLRKPSLVPEETKRTLKEGEEWAKAQLQR